MTIETYAAAEEALSRRGFSRMVFDVSRIERLLEGLSNPQRQLRAIHVAGTNGKTSTTRIADSLMRAHGLRTGLYTSPHLHTVRERIQIDGEPLSEKMFTQHLRVIEPLAANVDATNVEPLTYFDVTTALAFRAFAHENLDSAVVEVGLGGRTDSTNVLRAGVCVVTPIGLDHTQYLGSTIPEVAANKAGIIHEGAVVISARQHPDARAVLADRAAEVSADLLAEGDHFEVVARRSVSGGQIVRLRVLDQVLDEIYLPLYGGHQAQNAAVALTAVHAFLSRNRAAGLEFAAVNRGFAAVTSPGRLEKLQENPAVFVDGAHNPHGAVALAAALGEFGFESVIGVVAVLQDKDVRQILAQLQPVMTEIVTTTNSSGRAMSETALRELACEVFGADRLSSRPDLSSAVRLAIQRAEAAERETGRSAGVVVTGSVVTVADVRAEFGPAAHP